MTGKAKVLVVIDDDRRVREALESLFQAAMVDARMFSTAEELLSELDLGDVSCVLTDVRMPGMNGYELRQELNIRNPEIPVIFMSAHEDEKKKQALTDRGFQFLRKPFDGEEILKCVKSAINGREL